MRLSLAIGSTGGNPRPGIKTACSEEESRKENFDRQLQGYLPHTANIVYHPEMGGASLKPQEMTITTLCTEEAPDARQIILDSLAVFLKKELHNLTDPLRRRV